ncbi:hypothetical protein ACFLYR_09220 [Chloroflexota bacterium]
MSNEQPTIVDLWSKMNGDMRKFVADRPGWLIDVLKRAHDKKGSRG